MKTHHLIAAALLLCLGMSSCQRRFYAPALYQNDVQLMLKPHSKDSVKTRVYVSGNYLEHGSLIEQGSSGAGLLNIYRSHTLKSFNLSYGALGFFGDYKESTDNGKLYQTKSFTGYGFNGSASVYTSTKKADWRLIGIDLVYTHESGDYLSYRRAIALQPNVMSATQANMFTYGIFSEVAIKTGENFNIGVKLFYNRIANSLKTEDGFDYYHGVTGSTVSLGYKMLTGYISGSNAAVQTTASVQLGLAYRF